MITAGSCKHRLSNSGWIPVELIKVQSGEYPRGDYIVRFQDHYGRCNENMVGS